VLRNISYTYSYNPYGGGGAVSQHFIRGERKRLRWDYQFIALALMHARANPYVALQPLAGDYSKYSIQQNHVLAPVQAAILAKAAHYGATGRHALALDNLGLPLELVHKVRNRYLHRSGSIILVVKSVANLLRKKS